ncbi:MAG: DNA primase [Oscillospiraceae bacterium]|nr:DNA primase [Oscillospiraceae bacterium]
MAISDDYISELRRRADIETIISSYVNIKRNGKICRGLCPFHGEKTPSFTVYPDTQSFYCFGCGEGGDVIRFISSIENLDYVDSIKFLADKVGMDLPEDNSYDASLSKRRLRMYEANREAARFFNKQLLSPQGAAAANYCRERRLTKETVIKFGIGYAPDSWTSLKEYMNSKGFNDYELAEADLLKKSSKGTYFDTFRHRLVFPIIDLRGNVLGFSGRRIREEDRGKYVNTSDTLVYKKGNEVFALNFARKSGKDSLILCEGNIDAVMLHQAGFTNAVAGLGTALTNEQAHLMSRYASEIFICYDNDEAGGKATAHALQVFSKTNVKIRVLKLSGGKDPDEIIKNYGVERFRSIIDGAANEIEYKLLAEREKLDLSTDDGKRRYLRAAIPILSELSPIELDIYASRLASELSVAKSAITDEVKRSGWSRQITRKKQEFKTVVKADDILDKLNPERSANFKAAKAEESLIALILANPDFLKIADKKITADGFVTSFNGRIYKTLTDRLRAGKSAEISFLYGEIIDDEIKAIAKIQTLSQVQQNTQEECEDCIKTIIEEKNKKAKSAVDKENISDDDFLNFFKNNT